MYFNANDENHGRELWRSDGTPAGTLMVKDVSPGPANSLQPYFRSLDRSFMAVGGTLYFGARDGTHGSELWKSDGTEVGTAMVKDINSGGSSYADSLTDVAGTLLFIASDGVQGGLWKSDGTEAGTTLVKALHEVDFGLTDAGNVVYVRADDGFHGRELWMSDGTETGTAMVKDIDPGEEGSFPSEFLFVAVSGSGTRGLSVCSKGDGERVPDVRTDRGHRPGVRELHLCRPLGIGRWSRDRIFRGRGPIYVRGPDARPHAHRVDARSARRPHRDPAA